MEPCDIAFLMENWRDVPVIEDRVATDADMRACIAAFVEDAGQSTVYDGPDLPARAVVLSNQYSQYGLPKGSEVVIVQIETLRQGGKVMAGFVVPAGRFGAVDLSDLEIINPANAVPVPGPGLYLPLGQIWYTVAYHLSRIFTSR